ncbi:hypothetical protein N1851_019351 [Merluccius polli]|uniref:CCHC-type domain-containing protein n=1 Tax=Merluccius polli TaxID=89951 RepID=A0AA47P0N2_MERPO|nr:hypothetical protein N1851_019351 [Merluccius polli]
MDSSEMEQLQLEVIRELCVLPRDILVELCDFLTIAGPLFECVTGKGRTALITLISNYIQKEELEELEDQGMSDPLHLQDKIAELQATGTIDTVAQVNSQEALLNKEQKKQDQKQERILKEIEALQLQLTPSQKRSEREEKQENREINNMVSSRKSTQSTAHSHAPPPWHKDFKISGQIGDPGQKDRLTFSSLARQIEHVRILRSHYQEKSATNLYKQLTSEVQGIKETPQNILIRAFDLRQKTLFASQEAESGLKYDPGLVQNMFLHTALTVLQSDSIPATLLLKPAVQQNAGKIRPMVLSQLEEMRSEMDLLKILKLKCHKLGSLCNSPSTRPDGASVQQFQGQQMQDPPQGYWSTPGPGQRGGTAQYQQRFAPQRSFPPPNRGCMRRCFGCQQRGAEDYCMHCFRCGSSEHFLAGCRARGQRQFGGDTLKVYFTGKLFLLAPFEI